MTYLPRRPTGLRADQVDAWEHALADQYGADDRARPADPSDIDPGWLAEGSRAIERARHAD
ncbi:MAG TPA: hypothetical protein VF062_22325 [Candidatus Limnocylindrales bacterium]